MKEFEGKVAVVTGAAGGIGKGLAEHCVMEGMSVVLADVETEALDETIEYLRSKDGDVIPVICDVSDADQVRQLADETIDTYGAVHLLCNNAGVGAGAQIVQHTLADWEWVLGVNLMGVVYGVHHFLPIMLAQDTECHIVNTASVEGLWTRMSGASYQVSKHGVVAHSEVLKQEMVFSETKVGVSVLCPAAVNTRIVESGRNRPADLQNPEVAAPAPTPDMLARWDQVRKVFEDGMQPLEVAGHVFEAIRGDRFYILTHPEHNDTIKKRLDRILNDGIPRPDFTISDMPK
jgi:NAD(P)-dependent dehydrogenase (short-subunit alcohol dehydrogenase family)